MKSSGKKATFLCLVATACLCPAFKGDADNGYQDRHLFLSVSDSQRYQPKIFGLFSKPQETDVPKQKNAGFLSHLGTILHGGSIGIEIQPLARLQRIRGYAKKFIPQVIVGHSLAQKPSPHKPTNRDDWELWEKPIGTKPEILHSTDDSKEVKKPKGDGLQWDNIGEDLEDYNGEIPIEDIIQPRLKPRSRSRRFIDSKIYHVPLAFMSNGHVYKVMSRNKNGLRSSKRSKVL